MVCVFFIIISVTYTILGKICISGFLSFLRLRIPHKNVRQTEKLMNLEHPATHFITYALQKQGDIKIYRVR